jgi:dynein heavy chain
MKGVSKKHLRELRREYYVEDSKFIELLSVFHKYLKKKKKEMDKSSGRLKAGIEKLSEMHKMVIDLRVNLEQTMPVLSKTSFEVEDLLKALAEKRAEASQNMLIVQEEGAKAAEKAAEAKSLQDEAEAELAKAIPALDAAEKALKKLQRKDITELKSFPNPPAGLTILLEAVCIIFGRKPKKVEGPNNTRVDDYWDEIRLLFADANLLSKLLNFNKDAIPGN